jgi:pyruvate,water dikinase
MAGVGTDDISDSNNGLAVGAISLRAGGALPKIRLEAARAARPFLRMSFSLRKAYAFFIPCVSRILRLAHQYRFGEGMFRLRKLLKGTKRPEAVEALRRRVERFRDLVERNNRVLGLMTDAEQKLSGEFLFDNQYLRWLDGELAVAVHAVIQDLLQIIPGHHLALEDVFQRIRNRIAATLGEGEEVSAGPLCVKLEHLGSEEAAQAGEKMARLGELLSRPNIPVPPGFVVTARAFDGIIRHPPLAALIDALDSPNADLDDACAQLQACLNEFPLPKDVVKAIKSGLKPFGRHVRFAVRSSAIGEDGQLSFAGVHASELNVSRDRVIEACRQVVASLFSKRAVLYRRSHGWPMKGAAMAVGCMRMVPALASGVLYSLDPADPASDAMLVSTAWGYGTTVVKGTGPADRFLIARRPPHRILDATIAEKTLQFLADAAGGLRCVPVVADRRTEPSIGGPELSRLATIALAIERHMRAPQDIEWAVTRGPVWGHARVQNVARNAEVRHALKPAGPGIASVYARPMLLVS